MDTKMQYGEPPASDKNLTSFLGVHRTILLGIAIGLLLVVTSFLIEDYLRGNLSLSKLLIDLLRESGLVIVAVWGISLFYEKYIADRHFTTFHTKLTDLIGRGESNAAVCEGLGILNIYRDRRSYEEQHSFADEVSRLGDGDHLRIIGRSLIFLMYDWQRLKPLIENGATLQLCLINPTLRNDVLKLVAGYSATETTFAIERFMGSFLPWLQDSKPKGEVEIRFHQIALLDSYTEKREKNVYRSVWDLNFGEGVQSRIIFYLNSEDLTSEGAVGVNAFGVNLRKQRYGKIWDGAERVFEYRNGAITLNTIKEHYAQA
jgi:hypothetical protein